MRSIPIRGCPPLPVGRVLIGGDHASLNASWGVAQLTCGEIRSYHVSLRTTEGEHQWSSLPLHPGVRSISIPSDVIASLAHNTRGIVTVRAVTLATLSSETSALLTIDRTAPTVYTGDKAAVKIRTRWEEPTAAEPFTGLQAGALVVCVPAASSQVEVSWGGMHDSESSAHFSLGRGDDTIPLGTSTFWTANSNFLARQFSNSTAVSAQPFLVTACNPLGLCSSAASLPVLLVTYPPRAGLVVVALSAGASEGYLLRGGGSLLATWSGFESGTITPSLRYDSCLGTARVACIRPFIEARDGVLSQSFSTSYLQCGVTYFVTVRARNCAGLQHVVRSAGVRSCCAPPGTGRLRLFDGLGASIKDFLGVVPKLNLSWSGFPDLCSGIREYRVSVAAATDGHEMWNTSLHFPRLNLMPTQAHTEVGVLPMIRQQSMQQIPDQLLASLQDLQQYVFTVRATNHVGSSRVADVTVVVDRGVPSGGVVFNSAAQRNFPCISMRTPIHVTWHAFEARSGLTSIEWAVTNETDVIKPFEVLSEGVAGSIPRQWPGAVSALQPGMTVYNVLRIRSGSGAVLIVPSPGVTVTAPPNTSIAEACLQTAALSAPSSRSGWGVPPQFLPLLFG